MSPAWTLIRLSLILLIIQSASCGWKPNNRKKEVSCITQECEAWGTEYKKNMNTDAKPCQDFYTFTCGSWHNNHPGPKYAAEWGLLDVMNSNFLHILRRSLESYNDQPGGSKLFRNAKEVYETCVNIPEYPKSDASNIAREIMQIGRVPNSPLWNIHFKYLKLTGESAFFQTRLMASSVKESIPVLIVMEPSSAYGSILHEETWKAQEKQAYTDFLFLIMKNLRLKDPDALIKERIEKVFDFRKKLEKIIDRNSGKKPEPFNPLTGLQLDTWFSDTIPAQIKTQKIPWTDVIEVLLHSLTPEKRQNRKVIAMRQREYFLDLMDLLKNVPDEVLGNHMEIYFVERHLNLEKKMYKLLEATSVEPHGLFRYIRAKYYPRWQTCIENHNMKETLEKLVYQKWFSKNNTEIVRQLNGRIKIAVEDQMKKCKWLDQPTREEITRKLYKLEEWIGFPPWIDGVGTPIERVKKEILTPDASLNIHFNLLYVHAPLLLPPLFSPTIPTLYNYAGIGASLGHELYHIIDDCGSYLEVNGNIVWWPEETRAKCLNNKLRFINVYNEITERDYKNRYKLDIKSNTSSTILENIPDVMGLQAAYNAYKELASKEESVCKTLPFFENYSCDQMFYIAFANTYCGYYTTKSAENKLQLWEHSIDSVRINGAVAQMESFGEAFGCPVGSPMNPRRKLDLWQ